MTLYKSVATGGGKQQQSSYSISGGIEFGNRLGWGGCRCAMGARVSF